MVLLCIKNATKEMESPLKIYLVDSLRNITYLIFFYLKYSGKTPILASTHAVISVNGEAVGSQIT